LFERLVKNKKCYIPYFTVVLIVGITVMPNAFAATTVTIQMDKTTYSYGEKLFYEIQVSEVTGEIAVISISDEQGKASSGIPIPISELTTPVPSLYPFEREIFPVGKYFIKVEYSGASDLIEFELIDSGNIVIPFWIKQVAYYWVSEEISDGTFADAIEFLIQNKIIVVHETAKESSSDNTQIPTWVKTNTTWWLEEKISDTDFALGIQYLIKVGIIVV
jgi:hypothetical protein